MTEPLPFSIRIWFCFLCWFRVLFDGAFARRCFEAQDEPKALPVRGAPKAIASARETDVDSALQLLGLLQREGRFVDFVQQDIDGFSDADVGAAARVVHSGCRAAIGEHARLSPVRTEPEGQPITVPAGFDPDAIKLTGNVAGEPPYDGTLRHCGWKVDSLDLPKKVEGHDLRVIAPAEIEL